MSRRKSKTVATGKGKSGCASVNGWANTAKLQVRDIRKRLAKMPDPDNRALVNRFYMNELLDKLEANLDSIRAETYSTNEKGSDGD